LCCARAFNRLDSMKRIGLYPGSFDPPTNGHLGMFAASLRLVDHLVIAVGVHPSKAPLFTFAEREAMLNAIVAPMAKQHKATFEVKSFSGLMTEFASETGATLLIRGLRDGTDLDYEMQLAGMNGVLAPGVQTVFLPANPKDRPITATLVRQVASMGGKIDSFVPPEVAKALKAKFSK
jgi:pantetheine-phosphate adenylyltransferase